MYRLLILFKWYLPLERISAFFTFRNLKLEIVTRTLSLNTIEKVVSGSPLRGVVKGWFQISNLLPNDRKNSIVNSSNRNEIIFTLHQA